MFGDVEVDFMNPTVSNHTPIHIECKQYVNLHSKPFKLFKKVLDHPEFKGILTTVWVKEVERSQGI